MYIFNSIFILTIVWDTEYDYKKENKNKYQ